MEISGQKFIMAETTMTNRGPEQCSVVLSLPSLLRGDVVGRIVYPLTNEARVPLFAGTPANNAGVL